ncbi:MAG: GNAT family N-acetyltransferase, partial [Myxococcota bacterium]
VGAVLPDYWDRRAASDWIERTSDVLAHRGIHRLETETAPANHRVVHLLNRLGFVITATTQSERWGVLLRFTRFLDQEPAQLFADRYCMGASLLEKKVSRAQSKEGRNS